MSPTLKTELLASHLNNVLNSINSGLVVIEKPQGKVVFVNNRAKEIFGVNLLGLEVLRCSNKLNMRNMNGELCSSSDISIISALLTGKKSTGEELIIDRPDGSLVYVVARSEPLTDCSGEVTAAISIFEDVTERRQLEEAMQRFLSATKNSLDGIVICDMGLKIVRVNDAALKMYETDEPNDLIGKSVSSLLSPQESERASRNLSELLKTGHVTAEYAAVTKNGNIIPVEYSGSVLKDRKGNSGIFSIVRDLSNRKQAENALRQVSSEWERTFNSLPDLIAILDTKHGIVKVNHTMARQLGMSPEQCVGLTCYECVHGLDRAPKFCPHTKTLRDEKEHVAEVYEPHLGGYFLVSTTPIKDKKGKMIGSVHVARNITERKQLEEELKLSQDRYMAAVEGCNDGIWDRDLKTGKVFFSDQWKRILGYEPIEIRNEMAEFDRLIHPEDRDNTWLKIEAHIRGETPFYTSVFRMKHKDGSWRWILSRGSSIRDKNGNAYRIAGSHTDITEQKFIEDELNRHTKELEVLVEERTEKLKQTERLATIGQTAGMVGHDIRNPLQSIVGEIYLAQAELKSLPQGAEKKNLEICCDSIEKSVEYINKIVLDLQDYAKPLRPASKEINLKNIIEESLKRNDVPKNVRVINHVDNDALVVKIDSTFLRRILNNLIINAIQAMPNGGDLAVTVQRGMNNIVLSVEDTGVGIPEEIKEKLFMPLFTTKARGQGFGLAVVKRLTEALNGTVSFSSQKDKGTKFTVKIPLVKG